MESEVLIIGGGAAGLMCAITACKRGRRVTVLEMGREVGKKILISGGGRCNFTNLNVTPKNYLSENEHFCKSALARYRPEDFIALVKKHGIAYHEKTLGQLFCDRSAKDIVTLLKNECRDGGVEIVTECRVENLTKEGDFFTAKTGLGDFKASRVVVATGGLTVPKIATDFSYRVARQFGLAVTDLSPALVPLQLGEEEKRKLSEISGVSFAAIVSSGRASFRENVLVTHRGLSGPAILQISSYWRPGETIFVNLVPDVAIRDILLQKKAAKDKMELKNILAAYLPKRFAAAFCAMHFASKPLYRFSEADLQRVAELLTAWPVVPEGTLGYEKAEVTLGGVSTEELSSKTMEAKRVPGLYFIGEAVDVTGWLGGYNFQWAWASGVAAGGAV